MLLVIEGRGGRRKGEIETGTETLCSSVSGDLGTFHDLCH